MFVFKIGVVDMKRWLYNLDDSYNDICYFLVDIIMYLDVFFMGWGVVMDDILIGGRWLFFEVENYINFFEFLIVFFVLRCF